MSAATPWLDERLAANGRPVRENFTAWYGSGPCSPSGEPLTLFHGTNQSFDAFSPFARGSVDNPTTRMGFFFTECSEGAQRWAGYRRGNEGQNVMPIYLAIQKPKHVPADRFEHLLKRARVATIDKYVEDAKTRGFDGLKIDYQSEGIMDGQQTWWVAFDSKQIKSAIGNSGLYLPDSASMTDIEAALALRQALKARQSIPSPHSTKDLVASP